MPYATGNPTDYLPCKPGTFLCKSPTQFYTCGQFGGPIEWTYGALRDVAEGMMCEPKLVKGSAKKSKRAFGWFATLGGDRVGGGDDGGGGVIDTILEKLDDLTAKVEKLLGHEGYSDDDWSDDDDDDDDEDSNGWYKKIKKRALSIFEKRQTEENANGEENGDILDGMLDFSDGSDGGDGLEDDVAALFPDLAEPNTVYDGLDGPDEEESTSNSYGNEDEENDPLADVDDDSLATTPSTNSSSSVPEEEDDDDLQEKLRRRANPTIPGFTFATGGAGDGVDDDASALFGAEPADYDQTWGLSPEAEDVSPPEALPTLTSKPATTKPSTLRKVATASKARVGKRQMPAPRPMGPGVPAPGPGGMGSKPAPGPIGGPAMAHGAQPPSGPAFELGATPGGASPAMAQGVGPQPGPNQAPQPGAVPAPESTYDGDGGEGLDDDVAALFPDLKQPDALLDGVQGSDADGGDQPAETDSTSVEEPTPTSTEEAADQAETSLEEPTATPTEADVEAEDVDDAEAGEAFTTPIPAMHMPLGTGIENLLEAVATPVSSIAPPFNTSAALTNSSAEEAGEEDPEDDWADGVLPFYPEDAPTPTSTPSSTTNIAASILPYFLGPGPVIPSGANISWPGPVGLGGATPAPSSSSSTTPSTSATVTVANPAIPSVWPPPLPGVTGSWPPPLPGVTPAARLKRAVKERKKQGKKMARLGKRQGRGKCPFVPRGYYRDDQYVRRG